MANATVFVPRHPATPRGALLFARLLDLVLNRPPVPLSAEERLAQRVGEAEMLRREARRIQRMSPGQATDLFAAADRHENQE